MEKYVLYNLKIQNMLKKPHVPNKLTSKILKKWNSSILLSKIWRLEAILVLELLMGIFSRLLLLLTPRGQGHDRKDEKQGQSQAHNPLTECHTD